MLVLGGTLSDLLTIDINGNLGVDYARGGNKNYSKSAYNPKIFFRLNNSLHLFETHCTFLPLFSPNLDFL